MEKEDDFSTWWYWELLREARRLGPHSAQAETIRYEMKRRREEWKVWAQWIFVSAAVIAAIAIILPRLNSK